MNLDNYTLTAQVLKVKIFIFQQHLPFPLWFAQLTIMKPFHLGWILRAIRIISLLNFSKLK